LSDRAERRVATPALRLCSWLVAGCVLLGLAWTYRLPVQGYLRDQHYQEHFVYLWLFFALALSRSLRGPFRWRFDPAHPRDRAALALALGAGLLLWASAAGGSSTGQRSSLVLLLLAVALCSVPAWSWRRCVMHCLLVLLCFGAPYSLYFPLTKQLQWGVATLVGLPAHLGLVDYRMDGHVVVFPHYQLAITADCSGIGQLLTFLGIVALGVLSSAPNRPRTLAMVAAAVALAWASNAARVAVFVLLVGCGWTAAIDNPTLHAGLGFAVFLPFVATLVWLLLRSHTPLQRHGSIETSAGRFRVLWLAIPTLVAGVLTGDDGRPLPEPAHFAALATPPGHQLVVRAPSEASDRHAYGTEWLVNARFAASDSTWFDLFHYATRSRSHLCVHKVADCLYAPGAELRYAAPVEVAGLPWWRLAIDAEGTESRHVYFAFEVGEARGDDSWHTALQVFGQRLLGRCDEVRLWRLTFPGRLPEVPTPHEEQLLRWLSGFATAPRRG
jgi:exosortase/archaeosortase family protein